MKSMKKVALLLVSVLALGLFAGCGGSFDASKYVKALMDNSYKGDSTGFVEMKIGSAEEASALYEQGLEAEVSSLLSGSSVSDELKQEYQDFVKELLSKANYTVGEAEKNGDNFVVTVTYKKMKIFEPAMAELMTRADTEADEIQAQVDAGASQEEVLLRFMLESFQNALANPEYGEEQTATVAVDLINKVYTPSDTDFLNLEAAMFDSEALQ